MNRTVEVASSVAAGAGLAYFLDPTAGKRRRAIARDQVAKGGRVARQTCGTLSRDFTNRAHGAVARLRRFGQGGQIPDDDVLLARVRATLGRSTEHPRAIEVEAHEGCVTLHGPIVAPEVGRVVKAVKRVPGVVDVNVQLDVHEAAEPSPPRAALAHQVGAVTAPIGRVWQRTSAPAPRLVAASAAMALLGWGLTRRGASLRLVSTADLFERTPRARGAVLGSKALGRQAVKASIW